MNAYELMINTNHYLIKDGVLNDKQTSHIINLMLSARSTDEQAQRLYTAVRFPDNNADGRRMYPVFFIPPYNDGKKLKTV
jgi:hypothetical protein